MHFAKKKNSKDLENVDLVDLKNFMYHIVSKKLKSELKTYLSIKMCATKTICIAKYSKKLWILLTWNP